MGVWGGWWGPGVGGLESQFILFDYEVIPRLVPNYMNICFMFMGCSSKGDVLG